MRDWQSQAHVRHYYCRYHVVFVPKYRKKALYGTLQREPGGIFRQLCGQAGTEFVEGYARRDHIPMLLMIPPQYSGAAFLGPGLLCQYGRARRADDPRIYPAPGTGREAPRVNET